MPRPSAAGADAAAALNAGEKARISVKFFTAVMKHERDPVSIELSGETEARLANEARRLGISMDTLLKRLIDERAALTHATQPRRSLPVWHLGGAGALHRRDIYDDAG